MTNVESNVMRRRNAKVSPEGSSLDQNSRWVINISVLISLCPSISLFLRLSAPLFLSFSVSLAFTCYRIYSIPFTLCVYAQVITTTGVKLRIRVLQPVSKPTSHRIDKALFFVHGVGGSSDIWMSQLKFFSEKGYHVIAPDLVGHGFSDSPKKPKHYEFDSISHHVIDVFDGFYKEFNIVIGHSYG